MRNGNDYLVVCGRDVPRKTLVLSHWCGNPLGGMTPEISSILDSLCRVADGRMGIKYGTTRGQLSARISIDLQRGFHAACTLQRAQQAAGSGL